MQIQSSRKVTGLCMGALAVGFLAGTCLAQDKAEAFQAIAWGQGAQMGRSYKVTVSIDSFSTPDDNQILLDAFNKSGNQGLVEALKKMPAKGRLSFTGQADYDITYIREGPTPTGRKIRLVTNRFVTFAETREYQPSSDYGLSALEFNLSPEKGKSTGTFLPACKFKTSKDGGLEIEGYTDPWRLDHITDKNSK
jgi:hypothetical protein